MNVEDDDEKKNIPNKARFHLDEGERERRKKGETGGEWASLLRLETWIHHHFKLVFYDFKKKKKSLIHKMKMRVNKKMHPWKKFTFEDVPELHFDAAAAEW